MKNSVLFVGTASCSYKQDAVNLEARGWSDGVTSGSFYAYWNVFAVYEIRLVQFCRTRYWSRNACRTATLPLCSLALFYRHTRRNHNVWVTRSSVAASAGLLSHLAKIAHNTELREKKRKKKTRENWNGTRRKLRNGPDHIYNYKQRHFEKINKNG